MEMHIIEGEVDENLYENAAQWVEVVMKSAYDGQQDLFSG